MTWLQTWDVIPFQFNRIYSNSTLLIWTGGNPNQACFVLFGCVWDSTINVMQHLIQAVWVVCNVSLLLWLAWPSIIYCMSLLPQVRVEREGIFSGLRCPSLSLVCVGNLAERHLCAALSCYCCTCVFLCVCVFPVWFNFVCPLKRSKWTQTQAFCCLTGAQRGGKCKCMCARRVLISFSFFFSWWKQ